MDGPAARPPGSRALDAAGIELYQLAHRQGGHQGADAYALPKAGEAPAPLLKAKAALVFNTSNTPAPVEDAAYGDPLQRIWQNCVFGLLALPTFDRCLFRPVAGSTPEQRKQWLDEVAAMVSAYFPKKRRK